MRAQTVVVVLNDQSPGQVYVYVGAKQSSGTLVQRAGLQGGRLYGVKVTNGGPNYAGEPAPTMSAMRDALALSDRRIIGRNRSRSASRSGRSRTDGWRR